VVEVSERATYQVTTHRDDSGWWFARVEGVQGAVTQARRLDQVPAMAREVLSLLLDVPPDSFDVVVVPKLPESVAATLAQAQDLRQRAEELRSAASSSSAEAAAQLAGVGLSMRDIGELLGVSFQRAQQLVQAGR
jgi:predicted RNase H-like HicB family nuclease